MNGLSFTPSNLLLLHWMWIVCRVEAEVSMKNRSDLNVNFVGIWVPSENIQFPPRFGIAICRRTH